MLRKIGQSWELASQKTGWKTFYIAPSPRRGGYVEMLAGRSQDIAWRRNSVGDRENRSAI
jgi:hypothetical protein